MKYYEMARRGEEIPQETKEVTVFEFVPLGDFAGDALSFRLACSSGTYARSLAHEVGRAVGTGAHLSRLRRTRVGPIEVAQAVRLDELAAVCERGEEPAAAWLPFDRIPLPFAEVAVDAQQQRRIDHGQTVLVRDLAGEEGDWIKLVDLRQHLLAVGSVVERIGERGVAIVQPRIVFK